MDTKALLDAGMTKKEAEVYLALVTLGSTTASHIIEQTGFHRAVVYDLLHRLIEKGLTSHVIKGKKRYFEATNPNRLLEIVKEKEQNIQTVLPRLLELASFTEQLDVKVYKGKDGIKAIYEDLLVEKPKIWYSMGSSGETYKILPAFLNDFHERRIATGIFARGLLISSEKSKRRGRELSKKKLTAIKYLPKGFVTPTVINIFNNKVTLYSTTKNNIPFIILIHNERLAKTFIEYFTWAWKLSTI